MSSGPTCGFFYSHFSLSSVKRGFWWRTVRSGLTFACLSLLKSLSWRMLGTLPVVLSFCHKRVWELHGYAWVYLSHWLCRPGGEESTLTHEKSCFCLGMTNMSRIWSCAAFLLNVFCSPENSVSVLWLSRAGAHEHWNRRSGVWCPRSFYVTAEHIKESRIPLLWKATEKRKAEASRFLPKTGMEEFFFLCVCEVR